MTTQVKQNHTAEYPDGYEMDMPCSTCSRTSGIATYTEGWLWYLGEDVHGFFINLDQGGQYIGATEADVCYQVEELGLKCEMCQSRH